MAEALKVLELAGVLTWQHRLTRIREACTDLFGRHGWRWRVIRTSNAYVFRDPKTAITGRSSSKSENPTGTLNQELNLLSWHQRPTLTAHWNALWPILVP